MRAFFPAFVMASIIFLASSIPGGVMPPPLFPHIDKIEHLSIYALLGMCVAYGFRYWRPWLNLNNIILYVFVIGTFYGISDEIHQLFVPGRQADIYDVIVDAIGSFLGGLFFVKVWPRLKQ